MYVSDLFILFLLGEGQGESEVPGGEGGSVFFFFEKSPRRGGGRCPGAGEGAEGGPGGCLLSCTV